MLGEDPPVLADYDAIRIGMNLDWTPDRTGRHRVFIVVEAHQASLRDRCRHRVESIEPAGIGNELRPLCLEHLPDRLLGQASDQTIFCRAGSAWPQAAPDGC